MYGVEKKITHLKKKSFTLDNFYRKREREKHLYRLTLAWTKTVDRNMKCRDVEVATFYFYVSFFYKNYSWFYLKRHFIDS